MADATTVVAPPSSAAAPVEPGTQQPLPEEVVLNHPAVQAMKQQHTAEIDSMKGRVSKAELALKGDPQPTQQQNPTQQPVTTPAPVNEDAIVARVRWEMENAERIQLGGQTYTDLVAKGYEREHALTIALADKQPQVQALAESNRQQQTAGAPTTTDRSGQASPIQGVSPEYIETLKARGMTDEQIARIVPQALARQAELGRN